MKQLPFAFLFGGYSALLSPMVPTPRLAARAPAVETASFCLRRGQAPGVKAPQFPGDSDCSQGQHHGLDP